MSQYFVIMGDGGLGNRLRPILSLLSISLNRPGLIPRVLWNQNESCDGKFESFFKNMFLHKNKLKKCC